MKKAIVILIMLIGATLAHADTFRVANTGVVEGYFLGSTSDHTNRATLNFEDNMPDEISNAWLYNTSPVTTKFTFGIHEKDSQVVLVNHVVETNNWWYSNSLFNNDGMSHVIYDQIYLADGTPAIIVRWEDGWNGGDLDYNDNVLLFTNIIVIRE